MRLIGTFVVGGVPIKVYGSKLCVRVGPKGPITSAPAAFGAMTKGEARPIRRAMFAMGLTRLAAAPRGLAA